MNGISLDLSGRIDPATIELYEQLVNAAAAVGVRIFVVGATARDLLLERAYNIRPYRATEDIDLGVRVDHWGEFQALKQALLASGSFIQDRRLERLLYRDLHPVDIIPFGPIGGTTQEITWPPDDGIVMKLTGFEEAYQAAITVCLRARPHLEIRVASLAGVAVLKFCAWQERGAAGGKDVQDLAIILRHYGEAGNQDRLFADDGDLFEAAGYRLEEAGARLLARDIAGLCGPALIDTIMATLKGNAEAGQMRKLALAMRRDRLPESFADTMRLLELFRDGLVTECS